MLLIKLTQFSANRNRPNFQGKPVYINFDLVTSMFEYEARIIETDDDFRVPLDQRKTEIATSLGFPGVDAEGTAPSIDVCESIEQIMGYLPK